MGDIFKIAMGILLALFILLFCCVNAGSFSS